MKRYQDFGRGNKKKGRAITCSVACVRMRLVAGS